MSVAEAQARISPQEFREWVAVTRREPFAEQRTEYMLALVCAITANAHRGKGKAFKPEDFLPKWGRKQGMDPKRDYAALLSMAKAHNATVERKHGRK